ncbi:CD209 antigen-like protein E isoform X2 [Oryzias latipes]|uniref:CD209 antigen-like protein E isoform X2 n=1 Tax=Oryzias latipes TaxID=8090 RepID=UPI000CE23744|nr:CD209 antigen-like protein E isoform X2 [Oryzias latipes]
MISPRWMILLCFSLISAENQDEGWTPFNGHLYYFSETTADWQTSRDDCLSKGADLVVINDNEENTFVVDFLRKAWIGLYKEGDTWTWVDGSILTPGDSFWHPGQPNNVGNQEDRAEIGNHDYVDTIDNVVFFHNKWNDAPGSTSNYWICEKEAV